MWHVTIRGLLTHRLRLALTALAIVLGVGFVVGTLVLTDTMRAAFDRLFAESTGGIDVAVRGTQAFDDAFTTGQRAHVPDEVVDTVRAAEHVAAVDVEIEGFAVIVGPDGERAGNPNAPGLAFSAPLEPELSTIELRGGRLPQARGEVAIDAASAAALGVEPGDTVGVVVDGPVRDETVVGVVGIGGLDNLAGATLTLFDRDTARRLFAPGGGVDTVYAQATAGVGAAELRDELDTLLGDDYEVLTGSELADDTAASAEQFLGFFTVALLTFAGVALFVGAFLIANTFTIIVAQRTRELALLRAVGAGRRQLLASVLGEAAATGLVGAVCGLALGLGLAVGLRALLAAFGAELPTGALQFRPRTVVVALVIGVFVTAAAAVAPALKAVRVPPVAALQAVAAPAPPRAGAGRSLAGVLVALAGLALLGSGLFAGAGIAVVGAGGAVTLLGAALLSPLATRPLIALLGWPVARLAGIRGHLARENALRSPRRTAATASALMIGLGLVSFVAILAASVTASAEAGIERTFRADYQLRTQQFGPLSAGVPGQLVDDLAALPQVATVSPLLFGEFRHRERMSQLVGLDLDTYEQVLAVDEVEGDLGALTEGGLAVSDDLAEDEGLSLGSDVPVEFAATGATTLPLVATFDGENLEFDWVVGAETFADHIRDPAIGAVYLALADGETVQGARPALEAVTEDYPTVSLADTEQVQEEIRSQIAQLLGLLSALLLLSVLIALVGIVNTLGLSVLERVRELGLLRAVGMTRRQVRAMVRWEAVLIAVLGAVFGVAVGVLFGWLVVTALADRGITRFVVPVGQLLAGMVAAGVAGVLAAILPARRAARIDVLRALDAQ